MPRSRGEAGTPGVCRRCEPVAGLAGKQNIWGEEGKIYQNLSEICVFPQTSRFGALESFGVLAGWKGPEAKPPLGAPKSCTHCGVQPNLSGTALDHFRAFFPTPRLNLG